MNLGASRSRGTTKQFSILKSKDNSGRLITKMASDGFHIIPIRSQKMFGRFELGRRVYQSIKNASEEVVEGDIVIVSSKFAAMSEGRFIDLRKIKVSKKAESLASKYQLDPTLAELITRESQAILGGIRGFALALSKGILAPNAGIDRSNVPPGFAILYPKDPTETANRLRTYLVKHSGMIARSSIRLGVILSDSRITPTRLGTIGIAIGTSGFKPVIDFRGKKDLFGNKLKVTVKAIADQLSSAAQLVMGEAAESIPIVIIRGYSADFEEDGSLSTTIPLEQCLYIQGLKN
jgi:coenzyme F420-0:L-glutamate ligase / coenzyme F420-1:gamma-L-glutamate ligase